MPITLSETQVDLIDRSFQQVLPISTLAAELFYARLFNIAPEVQPLFKGEMKLQGAKLMQTLGVIVEGLRNPEPMLVEARNLAARHVTYGVTPAHYAPVGAALLWTLEQGLGDAFTPAVREAWEAAYAQLSDEMVTSAYAKAGDGLAAE